MSRRALSLFVGLTLLAQACSTPPEVGAAPNPLSRSVVLDLGLRETDGVADFGGDSRHGTGTIGAEYSELVEGGYGWEADFTYSSALSSWLSSNEVDVFEASVGARAVHLGWCDENASGWQPYASAGVALLSLAGGGADPMAAGAYVSAGLRHVSAGGFTVGLETKFLASTSDHVETYEQISLQFGASF